MKRVWIIIAFALLSTGCRSTAALMGVDSFFRPESVAFACYDAEAQRVVAMARCEESIDANDVSKNDTMRLLVLVTQWARGQVAAVDVALREPVDASELIPGFSYVNVGVSPTGIAHVDPSEAGPAVTLVSSYGAKRLETVETGVFHPEIRPEGADGRFLRSAVTLPDAPTDVAFLASDEIPGARGLVVVALPSLASIGTVSLLDDGTLDEASLALLPVSDAPAAVLGGGMVDEASPWERICPPSSAAPLATAIAGVPFTTGEAEPHRLRIDREGGAPIVLVADRGVPYVHRFELAAGALTELEAIAAPSPVLDLAPTPRLADSLTDPPDAPSTSRMLYGVDATDRSVWAVDYDETSPNFGDALAVQSGEGRSDRVFFRVGASRLEVITPGLARSRDPDSSDFGLCSANDAARAELARPDRLRGVFLSAALSSGRIQIVDVWDFDATCRGGNASCQSPAFSDDVHVAIRRNRPRRASFAAAPPSVTGTPTLRFGASPGRISDTGSPSGEGPGLAPFEACPPEYLHAYPDPEFSPGADPLICLAADPWSGAVQRISATFEGAVAGSSFELARIVDGPNARPSLVSPDHDFCSAGVLGLDNVVDAALGEAEPEAGYGGDFVSITSELPLSTREDPECARFRFSDSGVRAPVLLRVLDAARGRLDLGDGPTTSVGEVRRCFPDPFGGHIRVRDAYVVRASISRVPHRVIEDGDGRCAIDTADAPFDPSDPATAANFRALEGKPFFHPLFACTITPPGEGGEGLAPGSTTEAELVIDVGRVNSTLGVSVDGNVRDLAWSEIDQRLYAVDTSGNRLLRIRADRLAITERID